MLPNTLTALLQMLPMLPRPLGSGTYAANETTLVLKRGALSSDSDAMIMDTAGIPRLLLVRRRALYDRYRASSPLSAGPTPDITDATGTVLYSLTENHLTFGRGIVGSDRARALRLYVRRVWGDAKAIAATVEHNGTTHSIQLQGCMDSATLILEDGSPVARLRTYCKDFGAPRGSICLTIAPGVDIALAAVLALAFDECSWY
ncbi:hypothetical protein CspeluHIS016_0100340 [Cutaneotrichosporon spelunceum]|uniref:Tubby C-terminal-like domain-containing protein n=1 Tax=Cutaneotrichosporon spelunceum TaxID=1672016 RepID=A0AAD3TM91_9TREE|nr:hypothetical protein CspeluHIS016_0100340 [Cutaneotrichosporon spelunceum]